MNFSLWREKYFNGLKMAQKKKVGRNRTNRRGKWTHGNQPFIAQILLH